MWNWDESSVDSRKYASQPASKNSWDNKLWKLKIGLSLANYHQSLCACTRQSLFSCKKLYVIKALLLNKYEEWENIKRWCENENEKKGSCDDRRCSKLSKKIIKNQFSRWTNFFFGYNANLEKWFLCAPTRGFSSWLPQFTLHSTKFKSILFLVEQRAEQKASFWQYNIFYDLPYVSRFFLSFF